jgi:hypothetical protein
VQSYFRIADAEGYVAEGTMALDLRPAGDISLRFGSVSNSFRLIVHETVFAGKLSKDRLSTTMSALADVDGALESVDDANDVLSACDPLAEAYLGLNLPPLLIGAADMPSDPHHPKSAKCDAISFALEIDAEAALLSGKTSDKPRESPRRRLQRTVIDQSSLPESEQV